MNRTSLSLAAAALVCGLAACNDGSPVEPQDATKPSYAVSPGTGSPAIDEQLGNLNNQVVACVVNGELDRQTASRLALLTTILRFTHSPEAKTRALLHAFLIQVEHARTRGEISEGCANQLTGTANDILSEL